MGDDPFSRVELDGGYSIRGSPWGVMSDGVWAHKESKEP